MTRLRPGSSRPDRLEIILLLVGRHAPRSRFRSCAETTTATAPSSAARASDPFGIAHCPCRRRLPRHCRHRAPAWTTAGRARRTASRSSGSISTRRAGLPSRSSTRQRLIRSSELLGLLVAALGLFFERDDALFEAFEIGQHQLGLDRLDVADRIDVAFDMGDVAILEAAHDMGDGVAFADIGRETGCRAPRPWRRRARGRRCRRRSAASE